MPTDKPLDPTRERARATEAVEATPISGKAHEYRADGDHRPRPDATTVGTASTDKDTHAASAQQPAPDPGVEAERHISEGIPGAGESPEPLTPP